MTSTTECLETRAAMQDYLRHRVLPGHGRRIEDHLVGCAGCIREFVDLRQSRWAAAPRAAQRPSVDLSVRRGAALPAAA